jgi:predicted Zn-dependent protease
MSRPLYLAAAVLVAGFAATRWLAPVKPKTAPVAAVSSPALHSERPTEAPKQPLPAPRPYSSAPPSVAQQPTQPAASETPERRVARLKQALVGNPENAQLLYELGLALARDLHAPEEGIPHLEKSVKNDSGNGNAFYDLVGAYLESNNVDRGTKYLDDLVRADIPNKAAAYAALADLRAASGDPLGALPDVQKAHEADPHSPAITAMAASTYLQTGDPRAEEMLRLSIQQQMAKIQEKSAQGLQVDADHQDLEQMLRGQADFLAQTRRLDELRQMSASASEALKSHINQLLQQGGG